MIFINNFKRLVKKIMNNERYSLYLNEVRISSGTNLNSSAGPKGEGQDARSNFVPFMQYAG